MDLTKSAGVAPRFFCCLSSLRGALATKQSSLSCRTRTGLLRGACQWARVRATRWLAMTIVANAYRTQYLLCYKASMFRDRQTIASRVVLDDRSRLPWRFFGRLTTAALAD